MSWLSLICLSNLSIEDNVIVYRDTKINRGVSCYGTYREFESRFFPAVTAEAALPAMPELTLLDDVDDMDLTG